MKHTFRILSVFIICLMLAACGTDKPNEQDVKPPVTQQDGAGTNDTHINDNSNNDAQTSLPAVWRDEVKPTDYISATLKREISVMGYNERDLEVNYRKTLEYPVDFCNELYYITTLTDSLDIPAADLSQFGFSAVFKKEDGSTDSVDMVLSSFAKNGKRYLGLQDEHGTVQWLSDAALLYFNEICYNQGITYDNFLFIPSDMISSVQQMVVATPFIVHDPDRELTVNQAAKKLMMGILESYTIPAPNRTFTITNYVEQSITVYKPAKGEKQLSENQWIVCPSLAKFRYEGVTYGEDNMPRWLLEYRDGEWRLHCRDQGVNFLEPEPPDSYTLCSYDYDTVTLTAMKSGAGYVPIEQESWGVKIIENTMQYTFYYDYTREHGSFVSDLYMYLHSYDKYDQTNRSFDKPSLTARFYQREGEQEEIVEFVCVDERIYVKQTDGAWIRIREEASDSIVQTLDSKGIKKEYFFRGNIKGSMFEWLCSLNNRAPMLLYDIDHKLTAEQAAEQMLYELGKELTIPDLNRLFYYEDYTGWDFKLYDNKEDDAYIKQNEYLKIWTLADGQYVVSVGEVQGKYIGVSNDGGPDPYFFLEYEDGFWRLWLRERP